MTDLTDLERRVSVLEDIEAIKRLKYRYWRDLDLKQWDDLAECFVDDATVRYGDGKYTFAGRDAILRFLRESLGEHTGAVTVHHGHHPEIELTSPTTARATWALYNYMYNVQHNRAIRIGSYYEDEHVKVGGAWKFKHIGYRAIFHEEWKRDDIPSLRLVTS
jgi:bile-acid 7alpha-dehydratase